MERIVEFKKKKDDVSKLAKKKIELMRKAGIVEENLQKYREDVKA